VAVSELLVVANRGPTVLVDAAGEFRMGPSAGGLAPSFLRALKGSGARWVAAALSDAERQAARSGVPPEVAGGIDLSFVELDHDVFAAAYNVIANGTLWFLFHEMFDAPRRPVFDRHWHEAWARFHDYTRAFSDEVARTASQGATVVVNDYHLALLGSYLAEARPDLRTVHFTHTPWCSPGALALLPPAPREELLSGLSSFGAAGFHVPRWAESFRECAAAAGLEPEIFTAPLGVDQAELAELAASENVATHYERLIGDLDGRQLVARTDRVELSKNLIRGFLAFGELLEAEPHRRGRVRFVARVYPSRTGMADYLAYENEVTRVAERVNERFGHADDRPIALEVEDDLDASLALLRAYDVLLVNPIRDGMNLVAKEGPTLNERDGVLALSRHAGAFDELGHAALAIDPFDVTGTAVQLGRALDLPIADRRARAAELRAAAGALAPSRWLDEVISHAAPPSARGRSRAAGPR